MFASRQGSTDEGGHRSGRPGGSARLSTSRSRIGKQEGLLSSRDAVLGGSEWCLVERAK